MISQITHETQTEIEDLLETVDTGTFKLIIEPGNELCKVVATVPGAVQSVKTLMDVDYKESVELDSEGTCKQSAVVTAEN